MNIFILIFFSKLKKLNNKRAQFYTGERARYIRR